jgi:SAM-dependent methyltransferase
MINYSVIRREEYKYLSNLTLEGKILDAGGSKKSGYHELIKGDHEYTVINIEANCEPDVFVDIEKAFPFEDNSYDHAICLNVLEHLFEFENAFKEQVRCVKQGGRIVIAAPFLYMVHGSPDDYLRYTESSYRKLAEKYNAKIENIYPLGYGFFSLVFQLIGGIVPTNFLRQFLRRCAFLLDTFFNKISRKYRNLTRKIPLGYFVVFIKN